MKPSLPSAFGGSFRVAGKTINLRNIGGKPIGFVLLAFVIGATISQGSFAFADDSTSNPFRAIWEAIGELQVKTDSLQAQIDDLKSQQGTTTVATQVSSRTSDGSITIEVGGGEAGQTVLTLVARNAGPDNSVGTKITLFYQRSLIQVNFVDGADCTDGSRGIIECYLGTLEAGSQRTVTIDAAPVSLGQQTIITAEFSSITRDGNPVDNRAEAVFITAIAPVAQPAPVPAASSGSASTPTEQEPTGEEIQETEQSPEQSPETEDGQGEGMDEVEETAGDSATETEGEGADSESGGEAGSSADVINDNDGQASETEGGEDSSSGESSNETGNSGNESTAESGSGDAGSDSGSSSDAGSTGDNDGGAGDSSGSGGESDGGASGDGEGDSGDSGSDGGSVADSGSAG